MTTQASASLEARRLTIRRRALANLLLAVRDEAARAGGRFEVEGLEDAICLRFHAVQTLVRTELGHAEALRDFTVIVVAPPLWPFDREAALVPIVAAPPDFRHPNSDSHRFCLDTRGVTPERLPGLVYDNIRVKNRRLDHWVDAAAAAFVRAHLPDRPADPRPLGTPEAR
jgi:hypothetical protein